MGGDGNSNSTGGSERKLAFEFSGSQIKLDGAWTWQAQFNALAACNHVVDCSFRDGSIRDVSDTGRMKGAAFLLQVLDEIIAAEGVPTKRRKLNKGSIESLIGGGSTSSSSRAVVKVDTSGLSPEDVEKDCKFLVKELQRHRSEPASTVRDAMVMDILAHLEHLPMTLECLRKSRIAMELNDPFWRGKAIAEKVRDKASMLVRRWRAMLKVQAPGIFEESAATKERRCRNLSMDLEECAYGFSQSAKKLGGYADLLDAIATHLRQNPKGVQGLLFGTAETKDFVSDVAKEVRCRFDSRKEVFLPAM